MNSFYSHLPTITIFTFFTNFTKIHQENLLIYRTHFDLPNQHSEFGSQSWVKVAWEHRNADYKVKDYNANVSLLEVTTKTNLLGLFYEQTGMDMSSTTDSRMNSRDFMELVESLVDSVDQVPWIWFGAKGV